MNKPAFVDALLQPDAYAHPCGEIELIETHISWVFLTGQFAYKVKKPVSLNFVDFSTFERREYFCREELRCNRAFAPELYDDVVPINFADGQYRIEGPGDTVEWAVRMVQFPTDRQLDRMLEAGELPLPALHEFGGELAAQHARLPVRTEADDVAARVLKPVLDNFRTVAPLGAARPYEGLLSTLAIDSEALFNALRDTFAGRVQGGFVRECHGDLHLSNLVLTDIGVRAFDCLEFNANLRWIDVASDVAFLLMDCCVRGREDLAHGFLDGYLNESGDYAGVVLSRYYQAYRSMVRAKVAALQIEQGQASADVAERLDQHLRWADKRLHRDCGHLVLMCGVSGSGKSYLAERLVTALPAIRLRSDVARKRLAGMRPAEESDSPVDGGLYTPSNTAQVYARLLEWAVQIAGGGDHVIVDATFLQRTLREEFLQRAARLGLPCTIVHCYAEPQILTQRVRAREQAGDDVSEAGVAVLERQLQRFEEFADEPVLRVNTGGELDLPALTQKLLVAQR